MQLPEEITQLLKEKVISMGFSHCGISKISSLDEDTDHLKGWLASGMNGEMSFMENYIDKRNDPEKLVDNAKSVISVLLSYDNTEIKDMSGLKLSKYSHGTDYHFVIKEKLNNISSYLKSVSGSENIRVFVDSAPVFEKKWAQNSGLGWIGKNTCLINKKSGSFFFIGEIISDIEFEYDSPEKDHCGSCSKCIESCPTSALTEAYRLDARRCISYQTIENKGDLPAKLKNKFENYIFGCDICQKVCPWNKFSEITREHEFLNSVFTDETNNIDFQKLTNSEFKRMFKNSVLQRAGFKKIKRNIDFIIN
jgi:epoxyqueuosine reductase